MRCLLRAIFGSLLTCWATFANAQQDIEIVSEPCIAVRKIAPKDLNRRIAAAEEELRKLKLARSKNLRNIKTIDAQIKGRQEDLVELSFARECFRQDIQIDPILFEHIQPGKGRRGVKEWVAVTTYFATNRVATGEKDGIRAYGLERGQLEYGRTEVSVPTSRNKGDLPLPSMWRLELRPDQKKHFILKGVRSLQSDAWLKELNGNLKTSSSKSVLIYVHGFNVSFVDAALRAAQLSHDLSFQGVTVFFSWPSAGRPRSYFRDEDTSRLSITAFNRLLDDVGLLEANEVFVIAHSMGNRIVTDALKERANRDRTSPVISELLLAAPDINEHVFREEIAPALTKNQATRRTIYASSNDIALKSSKAVHEYRRVGDTTGGVLTFPGFETIDATATAPTLRAYGHSYVVDSIRVLRDIADILVHRRTPAARGLDHRQIPPNSYWVIR